MVISRCPLSHSLPRSELEFALDISFSLVSPSLHGPRLDVARVMIPAPMFLPFFGNPLFNVVFGAPPPLPAEVGLSNKQLVLLTSLPRVDIGFPAGFKDLMNLNNFFAWLSFKMLRAGIPRTTRCKTKAMYLGVKNLVTELSTLGCVRTQRETRSPCQGFQT